MLFRTLEDRHCRDNFCFAAFVTRALMCSFAYDHSCPDSPLRGRSIIYSLHALLPCIIQVQSQRGKNANPKFLKYSPVLPFCMLFSFNLPTLSSLYSPIHRDRRIEERRAGREMDEQVEIVGRAFVQHYYHLFDNERASLTGLYQPSSILAFEGQRFLGTEEISGKLISLPFEACQHVITTIDCQPSSINGGIIVFVSGMLQLAGEEHQLRFSQMFHLAPTPQGSFYVQNDIFRLNYG